MQKLTEMNVWTPQLGKIWDLFKTLAGFHMLQWFVEHLIISFKIKYLQAIRRKGRNLSLGFLKGLFSHWSKKDARSHKFLKKLAKKSYPQLINSAHAVYNSEYVGDWDSSTEIWKTWNIHIHHIRTITTFWFVVKSSSMKRTEPSTKSFCGDLNSLNNSYMTAHLPVFSLLNIKTG